MSIDLPNSAWIVLGSLTAEGPMTPKDIIKKLKMPSRTITYALQTLVKEQIVKKTPNLLDMRQPIYHVDFDNVRKLRLSFRVDQRNRLHPDAPQSLPPSHSFNR
jgi:DNA-binding IclR family transcriptional regulator